MPSTTTTTLIIVLLLRTIYPSFQQLQNEGRIPFAFLSTKEKGCVRLPKTPFSSMRFRSSTTSSTWIPNNNNSKTPLRAWNKPYLAIITEPDACDTDHRMEETFETIQRAIVDGSYDVSKTTTTTITNQTVRTSGIDLVSIRVVDPTQSRGRDDHDDKEEERSRFRKRVVDLTRRIITLRDGLPTNPNDNDNLPFLVVVNNDVQIAIESGADGVHIKEHNVDTIPDVRRRFLLANDASSSSSSSSNTDTASGSNRSERRRRRVVIGTSVHDVESAKCVVKNYQPEYLFVGTCYTTKSHPEKSEGELEGPALPGLVRDLLHRTTTTTTVDDDDGDDPNSDTDADKSERLRPPVVYAIGGINLDNCREPVIRYGADGVAVIRTVMQAEDPGFVVRSLCNRMVDGAVG